MFTSHSRFKRALVILLLLSLLPSQVVALSVREEHPSFSVQNTARELLNREVLPLLRKDRIKMSHRLDQVVVKYKNDTRPFRTISIPEGLTIEDVLAVHAKDDSIEYAEPDYYAYADMVPNDPYYSPYQWHLDTGTGSGVNAEEAWGVATGEGVVVAVIDTGVAYERYYDFQGWTSYYQAPDLAETCFVEGYDFINNDTHPNDDEGHGTHVAGTIAQSTNNGLGVAGIAYDACIMPLKALDAYGAGSYTAIADAIYYAVDNGAQVINLSLGGAYDSLTLKNAVKYAYENDVTVIAAAGNDASQDSHYPSSYNEYVISVGATDFNAVRTYYSNYGSDVDVAAPGGDTSTDANGDGYVDGVLQNTFGSNVRSFGYYFYQGTSMAAPHVAGVSALLISNGTASAPDQIRLALETTAKDIGDPDLGAGLIDAAAALAWSGVPVNEVPWVTITSPIDSAVLEGVVHIEADAGDFDGVINSVTFSAGEASYVDTAAPYSYEWNTLLETDGPFTISASAIDNEGAMTESSIMVVVDNINNPPIANAGDDQVLADTDGTNEESVLLDASQSYDPDGDIVDYEWQRDGSAFAYGVTAEVSVSIGTTEFMLLVTDDNDATSSDIVSMTVTENQAPIADAGEDMSTAVGMPILLDASDSADDGSIISYDWDFGDGAVGSGVSVSHVYASAGEYVVSLTVTDDGGLTNTNAILVSVVDAVVETEVFYDSFEVSEWNGLWSEDYQNDWRRRSQRATEGRYSAEIDGWTSGASLTSIDIGLSGYTEVTITFDWLIERRLDTNEYLAFNTSTDGGETWTEHRRLRGNVEAEDVWHQESIDIAGAKSVMLRFVGTMSSSIEDANVDNVRVVAY